MLSAPRRHPLARSARPAFQEASPKAVEVNKMVFETAAKLYQLG
jgi:hypothetical protein